ncbi:MAG: hypothetical protein ACE5LU_27840 [Anaerolineae bacterium]
MGALVVYRFEQRMFGARCQLTFRAGDGIIISGWRDRQAIYTKLEVIAMLVIKGIYEHGRVRLLEPIPSQIVEPQEVTVTFVEPQAEDSSPALPQQVQEKPQEIINAALALIGLLKTLSSEQLEVFDTTVERHRSFFGPREITW